MEFTYKGKKSRQELLSLIKANQEFPVIFKKGILLHGDNLHWMANLLLSFKGAIDLVYIDPPFNTNLDFYYDEDKVSTMSNTSTARVAYSDKFQFNEYLEFIRERLFLIYYLLSEKGTLYLHIDIKTSHYLKILLDEIFGRENFINEITRVKCGPKNFSRKAYGNEKDVILVYSKKKGNNIFNNQKQLFTDSEIEKNFQKLDKDNRRYTTVSCTAPGETVNGVTGQAWKGIMPPKGRHWCMSPEELDILDQQGRIEWSSNNVPRIIRYADENKGKKIQDVWLDFKDPPNPTYPTEKNKRMLELIIQQSSLPNSIIMDCFCGSGSFLNEGVRLGRRVIGIDKSDIAIKVCKEKEFLSFLE